MENRFMKKLFIISRKELIKGKEITFRRDTFRNWQIIQLLKDIMSSTVHRILPQTR